MLSSQVTATKPAHNWGGRLFIMTITEARKVLGKLGENMSDTDVASELEAANLLKDIFFKIYKNGLKKVVQST